MDDQVIRLILQTQGQESIDNLRKSTDNYRALLEELTAQFARGDVSAEEFEASQRKLGSELDRQTKLLARLAAAQEAEAAAARASAQAAEDAARSQARLGSETYELADAYDVVEEAQSSVFTSARAMGGAVEQQRFRFSQIKLSADDAAEAMTRAGRSTVNLGQSALQASRGIQDMVQGGLGGGINNIEMFVMALGGSAGLAGVMTGVGVAALVAGPPVANFIKGLVAGANEVPELADAMERVDANLKKVTKQLEDYGDQQSLTNFELGEYNRLVAEQTRLEAERDGRREAEKSRLVPSKEQADRAKGVADVRDEVGGAQFQKDIEAMLRRRNPNMPEAFFKQATPAFVSNLLRGDAQANEEFTNQFALGGPMAGTATGKAAVPKDNFDRAAQARKDEEEARKKKEKADREWADQAEQELNDWAAEQEAAVKKKDRDAKEDLDLQKKIHEDDAKKREKDRAELEKGLGDDFIAQAESARLAIETDPTMSPKKKADARFRLQDETVRAANQRLVGQGVEPGRAAELASQAPGFVQQDIQRQVDTMRAGGARGNTGELLQGLQQQLNMGQQQAGINGETLGVMTGMSGQMDAMTQEQAAQRAAIAELRRRGQARNQTLMNRGGR